MSDSPLSRRDALRSGLAGAASLTGLAGGASVVGLAGCLRPPTDRPTPTDPVTTVLSEGFEDGLDPWTRHSDIGPEVAESEFDWAIERSRERAHAGEWSLSIFTEGDHDDGTAWATRRLSPPSTAETFRVTVPAWSPSESFNTLRHLVAYLGPAPPREEGSFPGPGENSTGVEGASAGGLREPLHQKEGWMEYSFEWLPRERTHDELFLSVGVSVVWEADATHFVDSVRVEMDRE